MSLFIPYLPVWAIPKVVATRLCRWCSNKCLISSIPFPHYSRHLRTSAFLDLAHCIPPSATFAKCAASFQFAVSRTTPALVCATSGQFNDRPLVRTCAYRFGTDWQCATGTGDWRLVLWHFMKRIFPEEPPIPLPCCAMENALGPPGAGRPAHPECFPIAIASDDPKYRGLVSKTMGRGKNNILGTIQR